MPNYTSNYKLTKPLPTDLYNIDIQNNNMDTIDTNLKKVSDVANESNARSKTNETNLEALKTFQEEPFEETGNPVQLDLFQDAPLNVVTVLEPKQAGSGEPSPSNIRPITGYDKLGLSVTGKNLFDFKKPRSYTSDTTYEVDGDTVRIYTSAEGGTWRGVNYDYITLKAGVKYTFSIDVLAYTSGYMYYGPRRRSNNVFMTTCVATRTGHYTSTVTPSEDVEVYMALLVTNDTVTTGDITFANAQIVIGAETAYEPYKGENYTVQIGQTVYGGKMDWLTGKLVAEYGFYTLTGADSENWRELSSGGKYFMSVGVIGALHTNYTMYGVCSHAPSANGMIDRTRLMCAMSNGNGLQVNTPSLWGVGTLEEWKAYLAAQYAAGTPVQVAYKLTTPIEIQLAPSHVTAVQGINTLYGDEVLTVSGRKDILWLTHDMNNRLDNVEEDAKKHARNRNIMSSAAGTFTVGGTITLNESVLGRNPIFLDMEYTVGSGRVSGAVGSRMLTIAVVNSFDTGLAIKFVAFKVSDDGKTLTVNAIRQLKMLSSGITVTEGGSVAINDVRIIAE